MQDAYLITDRVSWNRKASEGQGPSLPIDYIRNCLNKPRNTTSLNTADEQAKSTTSSINQLGAPETFAKVSQVSSGDNSIVK